MILSPRPGVDRRGPAAPGSGFNITAVRLTRRPSPRAAEGQHHAPTGEGFARRTKDWPWTPRPGVPPAGHRCSISSNSKLKAAFTWAGQTRPAVALLRSDAAGCTRGPGGRESGGVGLDASLLPQWPARVRRRACEGRLRVLVVILIRRWQPGMAHLTGTLLGIQPPILQRGSSSRGQGFRACAQDEGLARCHGQGAGLRRI